MQIDERAHENKISTEEKYWRAPSHHRTMYITLDGICFAFCAIHCKFNCSCVKLFRERIKQDEDDDDGDDDEGDEDDVDDEDDDEENDEDNDGGIV